MFIKKKVLNLVKMILGSKKCKLNTHSHVQHFMMWSSTLTTSSTISLPLRLRSTFQQLLNMVARATWYDGSQGYRDIKNGHKLVCYYYYLQKKHHLKREIRVWKSGFQKPTTMAGDKQTILSLFSFDSCCKFIEIEYSM